MAAISRPQPTCGRHRKREHTESICHNPLCQTYDLDFGGCELPHLHRELYGPQQCQHGFTYEAEGNEQSPWKKSTAVDDYQVFRKGTYPVTFETRKRFTPRKVGVCKGCVAFWILCACTFMLTAMLTMLHIVVSPLSLVREDVKTLLVGTYTRGWKLSDDDGPYKAASTTSPSDVLDGASFPGRAVIYPEHDATDMSIISVASNNSALSSSDPSPVTQPNGMRPPHSTKERDALPPVEFSPVPSSTILSAMNSSARLLYKPEDGNPSPKKDIWQLSRDCDLTRGLWVYDDSYPLYNITRCPFIEAPYRCHLYGRQHVRYAKYRWQPRNCHLPRFDGQKFLRRMHDNRVVFWGDSMAKNQFNSLVGLLSEAAVTMERVVLSSKAIIVRIPEFNVTLEFQRSNYLVYKGEVTVGHGNERLSNFSIRVDEMDEPVSTAVLGAGLLVFNTGPWWSTGRIFGEGIHFQDRSHVDMNMTVQEGFELSLWTVRRWLENNFDFVRSRVFYIGESPTHFRRGDWRTGSRCDQYTTPLPEGELLHFGGLHDNADARRVFNGSQIEFLDISRMSLYRADAHIVYSLGVNRSTQDCRHWCLPGPPDAWNEMMAAQLFSNRKATWNAYSML